VGFSAEKVRNDKENQRFKGDFLRFIANPEVRLNAVRYRKDAPSLQVL
jgi:hypothetical protein